MMAINPFLNPSFPNEEYQTLTELSFHPSDFSPHGSSSRGSNNNNPSQPFDLIKDKFCSTGNFSPPRDKKMTAATTERQLLSKLSHCSPKPLPTWSLDHVGPVPDIPADVVNDLCARFLINIPQHQKYDVTHVLFMCQEAYWFYLDFWLRNYQHEQAHVGEVQGDQLIKYRDTGSHHFVEAGGNLPRCRYDDFTYLLLDRSGILKSLRTYHQHHPKGPTDSRGSDREYLEDRIREWHEYRSRIPVCGAIILDEACEHVLMVRGYDSRAWTFPKGKINEDESDHDCAVREIHEEIGLDISALIDPDSYVTIPLTTTPRNLLASPTGAVAVPTIRRTTKLFVVTGVSKATALRPVARYEIREIKWFPLSQLYAQIAPGTQTTPGAHSGVSVPNGDKFYQVVPILVGLKRALKRQRRRQVLERQAPVGPSAGDTTRLTPIHVVGTRMTRVSLFTQSPSSDAASFDLPTSAPLTLPKHSRKLAMDTSSSPTTPSRGTTTVFRKITDAFGFEITGNERTPTSEPSSSPEGKFCGGFRSLAGLRQPLKSEPDQESSSLAEVNRCGLLDVLAPIPGNVGKEGAKARQNNRRPKWFDFKLDLVPLLKILNE